MKRKTYRIVWEDDPPRHNVQPSENRAPNAAGRNHAGPAPEQRQQPNDMPPTPTLGDPDIPTATEATRNLTDRTGSNSVRSEAAEQRQPEAIASPAASPVESAETDRYRTYAPEQRTQTGFGSPLPAIPSSYAERQVPQESMYPVRLFAGRSPLGSVGNDRQAKADGQHEARQGLDRQQIGEMIDSRLNSLRVYVLESDITDAQRSVKTVVEQASF